MIFKILIVSFLCISVVSSQYFHHDYQHQHHPHPYHFGYDIKDHGGSHYRQEQGDGHGEVRGSYGYTDHHGNHRQVHYVADHHGFRAEINTNEPGTTNKSPANIQLHSSAPHYQQLDLGHHHGHLSDHHDHHQMFHPQGDNHRF